MIGYVLWTKPNLGPRFPSGMFVAQDGNKRDDSSHLPQNFNALDWQKIVNLFDPPLFVDPDFNVRSRFAE